MTAVARSRRRVCLGCGEPLTGRWDRLACGARCRQRVSRARRSAATWSEIRAAEWGLESKDFWRTPPDVFDDASKRWGPFDMDAAAAGPEDALCAVYLTPATDALRKSWSTWVRNRYRELGFARPEHPRIWCNPPYSRKGGYNNAGLTSWAKQAIFAQRNGCRVVLLLPSSRSTVWAKELERGGAEFHYLPHRVHFIHPDTGKPGQANRGESMFAVLNP